LVTASPIGLLGQDPLHCVAMSEWRKYRWALHVELSPVELSQLPDDAYAGYGYARDLALQAPIGRGQNLHDLPPVELTIEDLAEREGLPPREIRRRINKARKLLFGNRSDDAIIKQAQREQKRKRQPRRPCRQANCTRYLPRGARTNRKYCDEHNTTAARVRRHRATHP
jgi:hypothetical protein